jgi:sporulation protein YlmC with PRC-barrel domain
MRCSIVTVSLILAVSSIAFAQEPVPQPGTRQQPNEPPSTQAPLINAIPGTSHVDAKAPSPTGIVTEQMEGELLSSDLIGRSLYGSTGEQLGVVRDILIGRDQRITALIVELDNTSQPSGRSVGIPINVVERAPASRPEVRLVVKIDPTTFRSAKAFEPLAREAGLDDNQDLTTGGGTATGGSVPPSR